MVQKKYYDSLKQGIGKWNNWRKTNPAATLDLTLANLSGDGSQDQQTVSNALDKQHAAMKPLLHKTMRAIHEVLKSSPA